MNRLIGEIASDVILEKAFVWLCQRRRRYSPHNDVWDFRRKWRTLKPHLQKKLLSGEYAFSALDEIRRPRDTLEVAVAGHPGFKGHGPGTQRVP